MQLLLDHFVMLLPLDWVFCVGPGFVIKSSCVFSSLTIISLRKKELVDVL